MPLSEMVRNPLAWYSALGDIAAIYATMRGYREQREQFRRQQRRYEELLQRARQPVTPEAYYQPMSEAERLARERTIRADLIARGLPPDAAYTTALTAEQMAGTESERYFKALDYATRQRQAELGAMGARAGSMTGAPSFPRGAFGAFGKYLERREAQKAMPPAVIQQLLNAIQQAGRPGVASRRPAGTVSAPTWGPEASPYGQVGTNPYLGQMPPWSVEPMAPWEDPYGAMPWIESGIEQITGPPGY